MTKIIRKAGSRIITTESKKPCFYGGKELEYIDLSQTTANQEFCDIKFKGENKVYCVQHYKLMQNNEVV